MRRRMISTNGTKTAGPSKRSFSTIEQVKTYFFPRGHDLQRPSTGRDLGTEVAKQALQKVTASIQK